MRILTPTVAAIAGLALAPAQAPGDLVVVNGKVFTGTAAAPWAEAIAIRGDRIIFAGSTSDATRAAGANARTVDVGGRVVIPGINDAHVHPGARPTGFILKLQGTEPSLDEVTTALKE